MTHYYFLEQKCKWACPWSKQQAVSFHHKALCNELQKSRFAGSPYLTTYSQYFQAVSSNLLRIPVLPWVSPTVSHNWLKRKWPRSLSSIYPPNIEKSSKCFLTYPPKIFPVGVLGNRVIGVDFAYQGSKPRSLRYVLLTHHSSDLKRLNMNSLHKPKDVNLVISVNWIVRRWPSKTSMRPPQFILLYFRDAIGLSTLSGHWK